MNGQDIKEICDRLDILIKLTVASIISSKEYNDQVWILSSAGFQPKEIAEILSKTPNAIRVKLFELRKEKKHL